jgi:Tfp pilus assembly pilus retraction ATPase PilT
MGQDNKLSKQDLQALGDLFDKQTEVLATKADIKNLATKDEMKDLKEYIDQGVETIMTGIDGLSEQLAEKEKVERLIEWAREAGDKIGVKPKV